MMTRRGFTMGAAALAGGCAFAASNGYYVPPEEAPHQATFMQWPNHMGVYGDRQFLRMTQDNIVDIANSVAQFEQIILLADKSHHARLSKRLDSNATLWDIPTEDLWARDSGPLFAVNGTGGQHIVSLNFNGWGQKQVHRNDSQIARSVAERLGLPFVDSGLVGEPGGLDQDGHGTLIAHESSWVIENRNPGLSRDQIEQRLLTAFGADRMVWAPGIWDEDITDYHIDSLARFTAKDRVLIQLPQQVADHWGEAMWETHDRLVAAGLQVDVIPEPTRPRVRSADFVASYANYYVCNGAVICAQFGDTRTDAIAADALRRHYPGREIVALNADALGELGGGIHCATQQWPA